MASGTPRAGGEPHVAIVGGGYSGTLLAINLLRLGGTRATLIERRPTVARGAAYSTIHPAHLLNVRAVSMSALADEPDHFAAWLRAAGKGESSTFARRRDYARYLDALLAETVARAPGRLEIVHDEAIDVAPEGAGALVSLAGGGAVAADAVVLAPGNLPPLAPGGIDVGALPDGVYVDDPWSMALADGLGADDTVVVFGTGLTMVDVALILDEAGFEGRLLAISRHGLLPRAHDAGGSGGGLAEPPPPRPLALLGAVRERATALSWRSAVDELRPHTQRIWADMPIAERARFLRHLRSWWDVHRHRIAPEVAARLDAMRSDGRLDIAAGRFLSVEPEGDGARLIWRPRGGDAVHETRARRIVNATGPQSDLSRSRETVLRAMHDRGSLRPDPLRIGIDVDQQSRAIGADGVPSDRLSVVGPMTRGTFWEMVAVPDIRHQVFEVARRLSGGERRQSASASPAAGRS